MDEGLKTLLLLNSLEGAGRKIWDAVENKKVSVYELSSHVEETARKAEISPNPLSEYVRKKDGGWAEREAEKCAELGIKIVPLTDPHYPSALHDLKDAPLVLYWYGKEVRLPLLCLSVVGTRGASSYGKRTAYKIGKYCAASGVGLISGGAAGIDGAAHLGACDLNGSTFAVFGTGVDVNFPQTNIKLFERIREKGALISEYPLGSTGQQWHFPRRNRIVAALSEKLVVVEAPCKSGAMITAGLAAELGREVWAVPGRIDEASAAGSNKLIYEGAYPLTDLDEFFKMDLNNSSGFTSTSDVEELKRRHSLVGPEAKIVDVLASRGEQTVDNIALEVKMSAADIMKNIAVLAARGIICSTASGRFSIKV